MAGTHHVPAGRAYGYAMDDVADAVSDDAADGGDGAAGNVPHGGPWDWQPGAAAAAGVSPPASGTMADAPAITNELVALGLRLGSERDAAAMAATFTETAAHIMEAECIALCLLDSQEQVVQHLATHGVDPAVLSGHALDRSALPGCLLDAQQLVRRAAPSGPLQGLPPGHPPVRNLLGMALRDRYTLYGWLYFAGRRNQPEFTQQDIQTASTLAAQLTVAYYSLNLYQVVQRHAAQLQMEASARRDADVALRASENRYRAMSESAPDAIVTLDHDLHVLHFNRAAVAMFGYSEQEMLGQSVMLLMPERYRDKARIRYEQFRRTNEPYYSGRVVEVHGRRKNGEEFIAEQSLSIVHVDGKQIFTAILRDTTQRRQMESRLRMSAMVFDSTQESIITTDADCRIIGVNPAFEQITGYKEREVLGRNPSLLRSGRHESAFYRAMWACLQNTGQWRGEIWNRRKNGQVYPERMGICAVRDPHGNISAYVSVSSDISALKEAHHQLDFLANHDPLTLLPNRNLLNDRLQLAMAAAEHDSALVAVVLFNIDRLQRINDSMGHDAGDALLQEMARRLNRIVTPGDTLAHLGADEFALMLTKCKQVDDVIVAARQLMEEIARPVHLRGQDVYVTASVGISMYPRDGATASALLIGADVALSHVKEAGRNGFRFFTGEMNALAQRFMSLETHLRHAIERNELSLLYQPQVSLSDGRISGMEALLRWHSPELGIVPPSDFIPLAEDTGQIIEIGAWVLQQACAQNKAWQQAGLLYLPVAVNVSARQLATGSLPATVRATLAASGLAPECLEIELTESIMMQDAEAVQAQLAELAQMGVSVSLDDFGTGYSSLGYLSRFTLDKLKIDQTFVRNITCEPRSAAIAQATIALAHGLDLVVVAEGVETPGQLSYLRSIGCDKIQGYLFSKPLAAGEFAALLREGRTLMQESLALVPARTLLLVDDEPGAAYALARLFRREGYRILVAHSGHEALDMLATQEVQVIVSDQRMGDMPGTEFLARARDLHPHTVRILLSGYGDLKTMTDAANRGAVYKCLAKPWDDGELKAAVHAAFRLAEQGERRTG
jgi:diguanylate cyclase (GGDEF)-like protein/PAS domain S-box-containing protein